jgi:hypothetical protein
MEISHEHVAEQAVEQNRYLMQSLDASMTDL